MRDLDRELDEGKDLPEGWRPEPGDKIVGRLVRFAVSKTAYGPRRIAVLEREPDGAPRAVWLLHGSLKAQFRKLTPQAGDRVGIKRLPDSEDGQYKRYKVVIDRAEGAEVPASDAAQGDSSDEDDPLT